MGLEKKMVSRVDAKPGQERPTSVYSLDGDYKTKTCTGKLLETSHKHKMNPRKVNVSRNKVTRQKK